MKYAVPLILAILFSCPIHADGQKETCRSYVISHSTSQKYCLLDKDEKIAEFDRKLQNEKTAQDFQDSQKNDAVSVHGSTINQTENE